MKATLLIALGLLLDLALMALLIPLFKALFFSEEVVEEQAPEEDIEIPCYMPCMYKMDNVCTCKVGDIKPERHECPKFTSVSLVYFRGRNIKE